MERRETEMLRHRQRAGSVTSPMGMGSSIQKVDDANLIRFRNLCNLSQRSIINMGSLSRCTNKILYRQRSSRTIILNTRVSETSMDLDLLQMDKSS